MENLLLISRFFALNIISLLGLFFDTLVYWFTAKAYEVFLLVSEAQLFNDSESLINIVTNRIYSVLGIVMLFVLSYNILKLIIDPDKLSDKGDNSFQGIIKNLFISIVILALLPTAFRYLYTFQDRVLKTNILSNLVLGGISEDTGDNITIKDAGKNISTIIFSSFFHPIDEEGNFYTASDCLTSNNENKPAICEKYAESMNEAIANDRLYALYMDDEIINALGSEIRYVWPLSSIAGIVAAYLFLSFAIDLGVRVIKFCVLQVIAPIPVILRITKPKGGVFDKWLKEISKTYLMVFERLLSIYFGIFILNIICSKNGGIFFNLSDEAHFGIVRALARVILILGTLSFMKQAPKLLEELFSIKVPEWNIKKKLNDNEYAKRLSGAVGSATLSAVTSLAKKNPIGKTLLSLPVGMMKGWKNGDVKTFRNIGSAITKSRIETNQSTEKLMHPIESVKGFATKTKDNFKNFIAGESELDIQLDTAKSITGMFDFMLDKYKDKNVEAALAATLKDKAAGKDIVLPVAFEDTKSTEAGKKIFEKALDDLANGNPVVLPVEYSAKSAIKDSNGNVVGYTKKTYDAGSNVSPSAISKSDIEKMMREYKVEYEAGSKIPAAAISEKEIKEKFGDIQNANIADSYNKIDGIKDYAKKITEELEKSKNILGIDASTMAEINKSIANLETMVESNYKFDKKDIAKLYAAKEIYDKQVDSLSFKAEMKKQTEEKK